MAHYYWAKVRTNTGAESGFSPVATGTAPGGSSPVLVATKILQPSDINALEDFGATSFELIPAPGTGKFISPLWASISCPDGDYSFPIGSGLFFVLGTSYGHVYFEDPYWGSNFETSADLSYNSFYGAVLNAFLADADYDISWWENQPLSLVTYDAITGGSVPVTVTVFYMIVDL